jgi:hypothetical protein
MLKLSLYKQVELYIACYFCRFTFPWNYAICYQNKLVVRPEQVSYTVGTN